MGGVLTRRARLNNSVMSVNDMASADVYEFRDDSEEEANRPRLILTIKSPPDPAPNQTNNNSSSTRKSRRLQVNSIVFVSWFEVMYNNREMDMVAGDLVVSFDYQGKICELCKLLGSFSHIM